MVMTLEKVVPFGRSLDEYRKMFALSDDDLSKTILGVADGPASFNAEMFTLGKPVVSVDPLYACRAEDIERQFHAVVDDIISQIKLAPSDWIWSYHRSPDDLKLSRVKTLGRFLSDYEQGRGEGRYLVGKLPNLDFADEQFQLALCSHFLFLYSDHLSYKFHLASVLEMLRIAAEVRLFPLVTLMLDRSPYLRLLSEHLMAQGYVVTVERVNYELQRGGNEMLRIRKIG